MWLKIKTGDSMILPPPRSVANDQSFWAYVIDTSILENVESGSSNNNWSTKTAPWGLHKLNPLLVTHVVHDALMGNCTIVPRTGATNGTLCPKRLQALCLWIKTYFSVELNKGVSLVILHSEGNSKTVLGRRSNGEFSQAITSHALWCQESV